MKKAKANKGSKYQTIHLGIQNCDGNQKKEGASIILDGENATVKAIKGLKKKKETRKIFMACTVCLRGGMGGKRSAKLSIWPDLFSSQIHSYVDPPTSPSGNSAKLQPLALHTEPTTNNCVKFSDVDPPRLLITCSLHHQFQHRWTREAGPSTQTANVKGSQFELQRRDL